LIITAKGAFFADYEILCVEAIHLQNAVYAFRNGASHWPVGLCRVDVDDALLKLVVVALTAVASVVYLGVLLSSRNNAGEGVLDLKRVTCFFIRPDILVVEFLKKTNGQNLTVDIMYIFLQNEAENER